MKFSHLIAATALATASLLAQASTPTLVLANNAAVDTSGFISSTFTVAPSAGHITFASALTAATGVKITSFQLFSTAPGSLAETLDSYTTNGPRRTIMSFDYFDLAAGNYFFKVITTGTGTITVGTSSGVNLTPVLTPATPVPEPQSLVLVLAGVGIAATLVRRRKSI